MSSTDLAWLNGEFLPAVRLALPVYDAGLVLGATISEQLRTFAGKLFRLDAHLERLDIGLRTLAIKSPFSLARLAAAAEELAGHNHSACPAGGDLGLCIFATPGPYAAMAEPEAGDGPTIAMHTYPLPFHRWSEKYETGQPLVIPSVRQVPPTSWPSGVKHRSRLHYYLADREAAGRQPGARALLLDDEGRVCEASTANILAYYPSRGLVSPPADRILPGISLYATLDIAKRLGIPSSFADLRPEQFVDMHGGKRSSSGFPSEVLLTSTPWCLLPVTSIDGNPIGDGRPGPLYRRLLEAWNELAGFDIAAQARSNSNPRR